MEKDQASDLHRQWSYGETGHRTNNQFIQYGSDQPVQRLNLYQQKKNNDICLDHSGSTFHMRKDFNDVKEGTICDIPDDFTLLPMPMEET